MPNPNKIIFNGNTLIDLTEDTVTEDKMLYGETAHNSSGNRIVGKVAFATYYVGANDPSDSLGSDGDLYLKVG